MKDIIDKEKAKKDIELLEEEFNRIAREWAEADGNTSICTELAKQELKLIFNIANRYKGFILNYDESEYENGENWYDKQVFTHTDFLDCNINESNFGKADSVAFDLKEELVAYIEVIGKSNDKKEDIDSLLDELCNLIHEEERFAVFCEQGITTDKDLDVLCENLKLNASNNADAIDEIEEKKQKIIKSIKGMM